MSRKEIHEALEKRYGPKRLRDFEFLGWDSYARVVDIIEPDRLRYFLQRVSKDGNVQDIQHLYVTREEAVTEARRMAARSRLTYRVVEAYPPEGHLWPEERPIKEKP